MLIKNNDAISGLGSGKQKQKDMTRVGFEPTPSYDDQEAVKLRIKV